PQGVSNPNTAQSSNRSQTDARQPIPSGELIREAKSKLTIQGDPTPLTVLNAAINATHPWTRYVLLQMTIEQSLKADETDLRETRPLALEAARLIAAEYQVPADFYAAIESQFSRHPTQSTPTLRQRMAREQSS